MEKESGEPVESIHDGYERYEIQDESKDEGRS